MSFNVSSQWFSCELKFFTGMGNSFRSQTGLSQLWQTAVMVIAISDFPNCTIFCLTGSKELCAVKVLQILQRLCCSDESVEFKEATVRWSTEDILLWLSYTGPYYWVNPTKNAVTVAMLVFIWKLSLREIQWWQNHWSIYRIVKSMRNREFAIFSHFG